MEENQQGAENSKWDFATVAAVVNRIRAGRDLTPKVWPNGSRIAVALSFDMDAETGFLYSGLVSPQPLSRGEYGPRVGLRRILRMLETHSVPVTFFIPAIAGQLHPDAVDAILESRPKHEIGLHGWVHERVTDLSPREERTFTLKAFEYWTERLGRKPAGVRSPSWDFSAETLSIIRELGLLYDSSLMADDRPYEILADGQPTGVIELPVEWLLDDYAYYGFDWGAHLYHRMSDSGVFDIFRAEFDKAYEEGTMFLLTMHPYVTGHRSRLAALDKLVEYMKSKPGVWFATHEQVALAARTELLHLRASSGGDNGPSGRR